MQPCTSIIHCVILTFTLSFLTTSAINYYVTNEAANTPGGIRFTKEIGIPYTEHKMGEINKFIWHTILQQNDPSDQKPLNDVNVYIVEYNGPELAINWGNNNINFSSTHLNGYQGDVKWEFTSLMYHEMTHVFQWDGEGRAPSALVEGIADYTKLKANYAQPGFAKPGQGVSWDQGYDFTARFLEYCEEIIPGFVAKINEKIKTNYDVNYFKDLTGKSVNELWKEYKAKYGN